MFSSNNKSHRPLTVVQNPRNNAGRKEETFLLEPVLALFYKWIRPPPKMVVSSGDEKLIDVLMRVVYRSSLTLIKFDATKRRSHLPQKSSHPSKLKFPKRVFQPIFRQATGYVPKWPLHHLQQRFRWLETFKGQLCHSGHLKKLTLNVGRPNTWKRKNNKKNPPQPTQNTGKSFFTKTSITTKGYQRLSAQLPPVSYPAACQQCGKGCTAMMMCRFQLFHLHQPWELAKRKKTGGPSTWWFQLRFP